MVTDVQRMIHNKWIHQCILYTPVWHIRMSVAPDQQVTLPTHGSCGTFQQFGSVPYDVFEVILSYLDGVSLLSSTCVCKHWNSLCELYISRYGEQKYWSERCNKELDSETRSLCLSGMVKLYEMCLKWEFTDWVVTPSSIQSMEFLMNVYLKINS